MSPTQKKRLIVVISLVGGISIAVTLILYALSHNINLFYTPTQLAQSTVPETKTIRVGGMVVKNSIVRGNNLEVGFVITDFNQALQIKYTGILPDLFKEGQGVVALGRLENGSFNASQILAKHDEKYMPPEIASMLKVK